MELKLSGEVILDDETMEELKEKVRQEVINDIQKDGLSYEEAVRFLREIDNISGFMNTLKATIPEFVDKFKDKDKYFDDDIKYKKIKLINDILNLN